MSGQGKYTTYAPSVSRQILTKIFKDSPFGEKKNEEVLKDVVTLANQVLKPAHQDGDIGHFSKGVDLDYSGKSASSGPPDLSAVKWDKAGAPANPYMPDITSPGPGKTDGLDKDEDPKISVADVLPAYVPGGPKTGTRAPLATAAKIIAQNILGVAPTKLGDSGANT